EGLSQQSVREIYQDSRGFMWFGTNDGLSCFDGYEFKLYKTNSKDTCTISGNRIGPIAEDKDGCIWVGCWGENGLNCFDPSSGKFKRYQFNENDSTGIPSNYISCLYTDSRSQLWIGTKKGLSRYNPVRDNFINYSVSNVNNIVEDNKGLFWCGTYWRGLFQFDPETGKSIFEISPSIHKDSLRILKIRKLLLFNNELLI
ncbi:MAG: hypothetical protein GY756_07815, partial [bacterium]|nr:hypothetical protein [bacterium]